MKKIATTSVMIVMLAHTAMAQSQNKPVLGESCRAEVKALCGAASDRAARKACMKTNWAKLTEGCQAEIKARKAARMEARKAASAAPTQPQ
jgi:hypothetical protein